MALKLQSYKRAELISSRDSAVADGFADYVKAYYDRTKLTMVEGETPTVFHVEPLTPRQLDMADQFPAGRVRNRWTLAMALRSVEGLMVGDIPATAVTREPQGDIMVVKEEWFAASGIGAQTDLLAELAEMVHRLSSPDPT